MLQGRGDAVVTALFMALRNLQRQLKQSYAALLTIAVGVAALLLAEGYAAGMFSAFRESTIRAEFGHLQITAPDFHRRGRSDLDAFRVPELPREIRDALPEGTRIASRFLLAGLISHGDNTLPFNALGVDPAVDSQGGAALRILGGERLNESAEQGLLLGTGLAKRLGVEVGQSVVLLVTTYADQLNARETPVTGIVASSSDSVDDSLLIMPLELARALMNAGGSHQHLLFLPRGERYAEVAADIQESVNAAGLEVRDWLSLADFYRRAEALFRQQLSVVVWIVAAILLLSISNTMMMAVLERTREIGTIMALGTRPGRVMGGFLLESALLGLLGVALGIGLACLLALAVDALAIQMPPPPGFSLGYTAHIQLEGRTILSVALLAWLVTVFASVWPANRAAKLEIVDALRVVR